MFPGMRMPSLVKQPAPAHMFIGLDLGRRRDPSAFAALEHVQRATGRRNYVTWEFEMEARFLLRSLEALPLGLPYMEVVSRVKRALSHPSFPERKTLVVDASGVGAPVVELLQRERLPCSLIPVAITGFGSPGESRDGYTVSRRDLLDALAIVLEQERLAFPAGISSTAHLMDELMKVRPHGQTAHDDRVVALALAAWYGLKVRP